MAVPIKTEPADIFFNGIDIFLLLFGGVGVIEAQVGPGSFWGKIRVVLGQSEIDAKRFGVPDMQVPVRFRGKPGDNGVMLAGSEIFFDYLKSVVELVSWLLILIIPPGCKRCCHGILAHSWGGVH